MNSLNETINAEIAKSLNSIDFNSIIRDALTENIEHAVNSSLEYGPASDAIRKKINEAMVPYIEKFDFSAYLPKLDTILTEILRSTTLTDNKKILENFKELMIEPVSKTVTLSEIFGKYKEYVAEKADCTGRDIDYDDGPEYEWIPVQVTIEDAGSNYGPYEYLNAVFAIDEDDDLDNRDELTYCLPLTRWKGDDESYRLHVITPDSITGLENLSAFEIYLLRLDRAGVRVTGLTRLEDDIEPKDEPEATYE